MAVSPESVKAFISGDRLPKEVVDEIERTLDDPNSEARRMAREFARLTRLALDPEGPPPGDVWRSTEVSQGAEEGC